MNIIFRFSDLEVEDLSRLNSIDASYNAKEVIEKAKQTASYWQAYFTLGAINNNQQLSYQEKIQLVRDIRKEIGYQIV